MEVVDLVDDGVPPVGRRRVARAARRLLEAELEAEADEPDGEADHEAPEGAELVAPRPEDGEEEDGADGRSQVAGHGLLPIASMHII